MVRTLIGDDVERQPDLAELFSITRTADGWIAAVTDASIDFSTMTSSKARVLLDEMDLPCAPVNPLDRVAEDPQVLHSGSVLRVEHPAAGAMHQPVPPVRGDAASADPIRHPAPRLRPRGSPCSLIGGWPAVS